MGVKEVRNTIMELQNGIDEKLEKFEQNVEKRLKEMENVKIKKFREDYFDKPRSIKQIILETLREEKEKLKEVTKNVYKIDVFVQKFSSVFNKKFVVCNIFYSFVHQHQNNVCKIFYVYP